jgi:hypothetical protein
MDADRLLSRLNPWLIRLLHSPLHLIASAGLMTITYTGRRSGRRITIPVGYQDYPERVDVLVSKAPRKKWWRNFSSPGEVELRVRGKRVFGSAELVSPEDAGFSEAFHEAFRRIPLLARQFEVDDYDRRVGLSEAQVAVLAEHGRFVRISITQEDRSSREGAGGQ